MTGPWFPRYSAMHIDMIEYAYAAPFFKGHILFDTPVVMLVEAKSEYHMSAPPCKGVYTARHTADL
jgi:hypothetical protein